MDFNKEVCLHGESNHPSIAARLRAMTRYLTFEEVMSLLVIGDKQTLYEMIWAGEVPATKIRGRWRFDPYRLAAHLDASTVGA
jgi:excisionase family DNA binding protein